LKAFRQGIYPVKRYYFVINDKYNGASPLLEAASSGGALWIHLDAGLPQPAPNAQWLGRIAAGSSRREA